MHHYQADWDSKGNHCCNDRQNTHASAILYCSTIIKVFDDLHMRKVEVFVKFRLLLATVDRRLVDSCGTCASFPSSKTHRMDFSTPE